MPDGTTWVSDGGLLIDAQIAKPATPPSIALTIENGKILARNFEVKPLREVGLGDLRAGSTAVRHGGRHQPERQLRPVPPPRGACHPASLA
jgi:hypothetical protein